MAGRGGQGEVCSGRSWYGVAVKAVVAVKVWLDVARRVLVRNGGLGELGFGTVGCGLAVEVW